MDRPNANSGDGATSRDVTGASVGVVDAVIVAGEEQVEKPKKEFVGRSPGQLAWIRLKRDRTGMISLYALIAVFLIAILAPVIQWLYGGAPEQGNSDLLDLKGRPLGTSGGISGDHWFGLRPERGQDVFLQLVFGVRTSLGIAVTASLIATAIGVVVGVVAGYARGWLDRVLSWFIDVMLAFPFFLFALAIIPSVYLMLTDAHGVAVWKKIL